MPTPALAKGYKGLFCFQEEYTVRQHFYHLRYAQDVTVRENVRQASNLQFNFRTNANIGTSDSSDRVARRRY